jgi:hypothetical protein
MRQADTAIAELRISPAKGTDTKVVFLVKRHHGGIIGLSLSNFVEYRYETISWLALTFIFDLCKSLLSRHLRDHLGLHDEFKLVIFLSRLKRYGDINGLLMTKCPSKKHDPRSSTRGITEYALLGTTVGEKKILPLMH